MRMVLDTNVMVAAMRSRSGASAQLVLAALSNRFEMLATTTLFLEYEAVMTRPEHLAAVQTSALRISAVLDDLARFVTPVERHVSWRPQLTDPDDEMVLETAVNGQAHVIVTFETRTFELAARRFGIETLTPAAAWAIFAS